MVNAASQQSVEEQLLDSEFFASKATCWRDSLKMVSSICQDLDSVQKLLISLENSSSHGSLETDPYHHRASPFNPFYKTNDELYTLMKRDHERTVKAMTEEYFILMREFLKEREFFSPLKVKDFDALRKKIPYVISKLNSIVLEDEGFSRDGMDNLLAENQNLRGLLNDKSREVECLSDMVRDLNMKSIITEEILATVYHGECSNIQTMNMLAQEISGCMYQDGLKDMEAQIKILEYKCLQCDEVIISLESEASKMEKMLALEAEEKHILEQKILEFEALVGAKDKSLIREKEQFKKELKKMMDDAERHEALIFQRDNELGKLKANLEDSLQQIDQYKDQMDKLTKVLDLAQLDSERTALQERNNTNLLLHAQEKIESAFHSIQDMVEAFMNLELETMENIKLNNLRLEKSTIQHLVKKASALWRTGLLYKQRLERSTDLQMAEAEVDLLGDEVETLLSLLEKICIALDQYSPTLQHYHTRVEILKLIQRELLNVEYCTKSIRRQ